MPCDSQLTLTYCQLVAIDLKMPVSYEGRGLDLGVADIRYEQLNLQI